MGQATRNIANSFTTSGVITSSAVNNSSLGNITDLTLGGSLILLSEATAAGDASISFTSGIDSTYSEYWFIWNNAHPNQEFISTGLGGYWAFNFSTDGGSNYNVTKTSSLFRAYQNEAGSDTNLGYNTVDDIAQGTGYQVIVPSGYVGNANDECCAGILKLYNPSSTTYVKHYMAMCSNYSGIDYMISSYCGGYCNTTSAINAVDFKMVGTNTDAGTIQMFGVK